jgi:hypothetical protein
MSDRKGWGSTVLGWFVVDESRGQSGPGEEGAVADAPPVLEGGDASPPEPAVFSGPLPPAPAGKVDFDAVFDADGVDAEERERVAKAGALLAGLPAGTDLAVRKQIVEASLKAFGVPIEKIIEAGVAQIQTLEKYIRAGAADTSKLMEESDQRIRQFEEEIRRLKAVGEERVREQQAVVTACNAKKLEVQKILEFFGQETVARVVRDSPKLVEPPPAGGKS